MTPGWLDALPAHPVFALAPLVGDELPRPASPNLPQRLDFPAAPKRIAVLARAVDLVLAVGSELRIISLADCKASSGAPYKTLAANVQFPVQSLVLNHTGTLLAVVGHTQVTLVVLPRKGWSRKLAQAVPVQALPIGSFYHSLPSSSPIAKVAFHEWGQNDSSLLVLTQDGVLREYSVGEDAEEPSTMVDLCAQGYTNRSAGTGFSSDDADGRRAVSFCFGDGLGDWGKLTLYGLMRNGDVVAVCPFLPAKSCIPISYIHALSHFVSTKVDCLAGNSTSYDPDSTSQSIIAPSTSLDTFTAIYILQLRYVNNLVRQIANYRDPLGATRDTDKMDVDPQERAINLNAPSLAYMGGVQSRRQGPFLMQPAPVELDDEIESFACDMAYISYSPSVTGTGSVADAQRVEAEGAALGVFVLSFSDGKVDVCLEVEKVEARWTDQLPGAEGEADGLPLLAVYESIDLGLLSTAKGTPSLLVSNWTTIVKDPLYSDTLYLYHSFGAHCLLLSRWLDNVASFTRSPEEDGDSLQKEVERTLKTQQETEVLWVLKTMMDESDAHPARVESLEIINDVYLGYSLLLLTGSLQLVAIDLNLRVDPTLLPALAEPSPDPAHRVSTEQPAYISLLDSPFAIPPPLDKRTAVSSIPRLAGATAELVVTPTTLRFLGKTVETFRREIRTLVTGADIVQVRLELQMKELARQLGKLDELANLSNELGQSTSNPEGLSGQMRRVKERQIALVARTDRVLQQLMEAHQPVISTFEKKWFEELGRLEVEIEGGDRSILRRAERVQAQIEVLTPGMEELRKKEAGPREVEETRQQELGKTQMRKLEGLLGEEARLLVQARDKLDRLTASVSHAVLG